MRQGSIAAVAGLLVFAALVAGWPSATQSWWEGTKAIAVALIPVLSAMFGAFLAVHGYEVREARALRRRLIEQMFRAGHLLTVRLYDYQHLSTTEDHAQAGARVNDAIVDLAMFVRLYANARLNDVLNTVMSELRASLNPAGVPDPKRLQRVLDHLEDFSLSMKRLSSEHFHDELIG